MKTLVLAALFLFFTNAALGGNHDNDKSASRVITGKVLGSGGESLAGAVVTVKETGEQFFADLEGRFTVSLPVKQVYSLSISTIGYQSKEVKSSELFNFCEQTLEPLN